MAIRQKEEPRPTVLDFEDWNKLKFRTTFQGGGYICIDVGGINDGSVKPFLKMGSRFEFNGSFYVVEDDNYEISEEDLIAATDVNENNYIYATVNNNNGAVSLIFSKAGPTWDTSKGGWYNGKNRALVKFFYINGKYNNKVILDSYNAMFMINTKQTFSSNTSGGISMSTDTSWGNISSVQNGVNVPGDKVVTLKPGIYRYEARGGYSGAGGLGGAGTFNNKNGAKGGGIIPSDEIKGVFFWFGGTIRIRIGANGGAGGAGGTGGAAAAGASTNGARGGPGGGGGGGLDTIFGSITAPGAPPTLGGDNTISSFNDGYGNTVVASPGSIGTGAPGGTGEGSNTNVNPSFAGVGSPGKPGGPISDKTNGYLKLYRIG